MRIRHFDCCFFFKIVEVQVGKKARSDYKRKRPKRFMRKSDPSESLPGSSSVPVSSVPVS